MLGRFLERWTATMSALYRWTPGLWILALGLAGQSVAAAPPESRPTIGFDQQIRPILSDKCFQCHGPDVAKRKGELRLDVNPNARSARDGGPVIVPGDRDASELFQRISSTDPDEQMPPPAAGKPLTPAQIELLGDWISQGARWQRHWSFVTPRRPAAPPSRTGAGPAIRSTPSSWPGSSARGSRPRPRPTAHA